VYYMALLNALVSVSVRFVCNSGNNMQYFVNKFYSVDCQIVVKFE